MFTLGQLKRLGTIEKGKHGFLKIKTPTKRVWLKIEDTKNTVTEESIEDMSKGTWKVDSSYDVV